MNFWLTLTVLSGKTQSDYAMDRCDHDQPDPKSDRNGWSDPPGSGGVTASLQPPV